MSKIITTEIWYSRVCQKNKELYDHSKSVYKSGKEELEVICQKHGSGCPQCARERSGGTQRTTQEDFIRRVEAINKELGWAYDFSSAQYKSTHTKVDVVCPKHGKFSIMPANLLKGRGCNRCAIDARAENCRTTQAAFIAKCRALNNDNLEFKKAVYVTDKVKVIVTCKIHGDFLAIPSNLLQGQGCPKCKRCGYNIGKPGHLYVLTSGTVTKVGITNRSPITRAKEVSKSSGKMFEVHADFYFDDGNIPRTLETTVHNWLDERYPPVKEVYDGHTECYENVDIEQLISFILPATNSESAQADHNHSTKEQ